MIERAIIPDLFTALVNVIVGQQISTKAFNTVWSKVTSAVGEVISPQLALYMSDEEWCGFGMSLRKVNYIKGVAEYMLSGRLDEKRLGVMSDEEVIKELTKIKGIGEWSAEMVMLFSLQRMDVLSFSDAGIIKGLKRLHRLDTMKKEEFESFRSLYSPYGSVASIYLWAVAAE